MFIRDVAKADLNTKPRNSPEGTEKYYADVFGLATEGVDTYQFMNMDGGNVYRASARMSGKRPRIGSRCPSGDIAISPGRK